MAAGTFPYLLGRFDCMHARMDRAAQGDVALAAPSAYVRRFHYDTILHSPMHLRWLAEAVGVERMLLGSDYSFPPSDLDPGRHGAQGRLLRRGDREDPGLQCARADAAAASDEVESGRD